MSTMIQNAKNIRDGFKFGIDLGLKMRKLFAEGWLDHDEAQFDCVYLVSGEGIIPLNFWHDFNEDEKNVLRNFARKNGYRIGTYREE